MTVDNRELTAAADGLAAIVREQQQPLRLLFLRYRRSWADLLRLRGEAYACGT